jgi:phage tail sheath protein FI
MPDAFSYPGVYIVEAPSSVHTIVGVPTAITAFVGGATRGPTNEPVAIQSPSDYGRVFGGDGSGPLDQAISLFFQNGGGQAIVVRVGGADMPVAKGNIGDVAVMAASPGVWGANIAYTVDQTGLTDDQKKALYNLKIEYRLDPSDTLPAATEIYPRVAIDPSSPRSLPRLLASSTLVAVNTSPPPAPAPAAKPADADAPPAAGASPPAASAAPTMPKAGGPTALKVTGGSTDAPLTGADLYDPNNDQVGFMAVAKHNTFFNLLVLTPVDGSGDVLPTTLAAAAAFAQQHRAMLLVDAPTAWASVSAAVNGRDAFFTPFGTARDNAAVYFPRLILSDSDGNAISGVAASGAVAGLYAATDSNRGVWKAPAGIAVQLGGITDLTLRMSDLDNGQLNPVAVNCLRTLPTVGDVVWGSRTMNGDDLSASQWKYIPVRRLALFIEESLFRGTQWVVFEPNDEPLWAQVRLNVGAFMHTLFRQGAFQGQTAKDAYFVKCDSDTNPQASIDSGVLNVVVGFAPLKPAEFVVVTIQQITGDIQV